LKAVRRYSSLNIGFGYLETTEYPQKHLKWKIVPNDFVKSAKLNSRLPESFQKKGLSIYHGFVPSGRDANGKNIKGTPQIVKAISRLQDEGHDIQLINVSDKNSNEVRFIQDSCDVILDQLIYGWWGSTGVEGMALGKPVICYLRDEWKHNFFKNYHEYQDLPVIEANTENIYEVLLSILHDRSILERASEKSIEFSRKHFDPRSNVDEFIQAIISL
jgi:glycosyltransferase involved in cell wall biosynthesis